MEESQEILLKSLENSGVRIPPGVSSIRDLSSTTLLSICAQSLNLIREPPPSFSTSPPDSMAEKFKICTDISTAVKNLGYIGDMSFHKFLYPSEEDLYKLVRFLVERLPESAEGGKTAEAKDFCARNRTKEHSNKSTLEEWTDKADNERVNLNQNIAAKLRDFRLEAADAFVSRSPDELATVDDGKYLIEECVDVRRDACGNEEYVQRDASEKEETVQKDVRHVSVLEEKVTSLREQSSKMRYEIDTLRGQEEMLMEQVTGKTLEVGHLEEEFELLKGAAEMAFDDQHPADFYFDQLNDRVDAKKNSLVKLEVHWNSSIKSLEDRRRSLEESLYANSPEAQQKLHKLKEVEQEMQSVLSEITKREEEHSKLLVELEKQPKLESRRSYIERIIEITKSSRKQDADIEKILKETRELQLESNSIQERLHRTNALAGEIILREAKKDPVGRQAYRLLTSIHESFEQISEKILATDRIRREVAVHEAKVTALASRSLNVEKLEADLDAIVKENECLEQLLR